MDEISALETALDKRDRVGLITIIGRVEIPPLLRAVAVTSLNGLTDQELSVICDKIKTGIAIYKTGDINGLKSYAAANGLPDGLTSMIINRVNADGRINH